MANYAPPLRRLIEELAKLPGIGPKSAQRLAFHLLRQPREAAVALATAITEVKDRTRLCAQCFNYSEEELCPICADGRRSADTVCVVADPRDLMAVENAGAHQGTYHVLHGLISPMDGIGPEDLKLRELIARLRDSQVREVILATSPTVEGDTTATYVAGLLKPLGVKVTQLAMGLPVGGDLDYADSVTIARAVQGRREL